MKSKIQKDAYTQSSNELCNNSFDESEESMLISSFQECSLDATSIKLIEFEKQYSEIKRVHDEDVSFFMSKLESLAALPQFAQYFSDIFTNPPASNHTELTIEENECLSTCTGIKNASSFIMDAFEKRSDQDRVSHLTLKSVTSHIEDERYSLNNDIDELKAANSEQTHNLRKGLAVYDRTRENAHDVNSRDTLTQRFHHDPSLQADSFGSKTREIVILKRENMDLENEKAMVSKSLHDIVQKKDEFRRSYREIKEIARKNSQRQRSDLRSLELRELDARQKSSHLEEANGKLDEVCKTLARTIDATKRNLASYSVKEFPVSERMSA